MVYEKIIYIITFCEFIDGELEVVLFIFSVDAAWQPWSDWNECSVTCENGTHARARTCTAALHGGLDCEGDSEQIEDCWAGPCPGIQG